jgi:curved DNA-binding protein CbpA
LDTKGYYAIMEVSEQANYREIRAAFRRLAKRYHPDLNSSLHAEETIKKINAAFEVLSDKEKRREYDSICFNDDSQKQKDDNHKEHENYNSPINKSDNFSKSTDKSEDKDSSEIRNGYRSFHHDLYSDSNQNGDSNYYFRRNVKPRIIQPSGVTTDAPNTKSRFQIIVEPSLCMAFGSCETLAPKVFVVEKNKIFNPKAKVISEVDEDLDVILAAAQTCPTKAILIIDRDTGEYVYP